MATLSQSFYSGGTSGYSVTTEPVVTVPTITQLPATTTPSAPSSGGFGFTGTPPTVSVPPGETVGPAPTLTLTGANGSTTTANPNDPLSTLLQSILGAGAAGSGQPAQITTISPTPVSTGMSKTTWVVLGLIAVAAIGWYLMKHKKAASNASA